MTFTDHVRGKIGNTRTSYRADNPRALIAQICTEHKTAGFDELVDLATEALLETRYRTALAEYYATNQVRYYLEVERPGKSTKQSKETRQAARQQENETINEAVAVAVEKAKLLGLIAPNGKPLAQCGPSDLRKFGGWYLGLAKGMSEKQTVGEVYTEADLRKAQTWKD